MSGEAISEAVGRRLALLRTKGGMKGIDVAKLLGTSPETVSRWTHGHVDPRPNFKKALRDLEYIIDRLGALYEPNETRKWMFAPQALLGGAKPCDLIEYGRIDEVMRLMGRIG